MEEFDFKSVPWIPSRTEKCRGGRRVFLRKAGIFSLCFILVLTLWCITTPSSFGDSASYFYDDLGRLSRVVKGTSGAIYTYDELDNILSVVSGTTLAAPPVIDAINPDVLFIGSKLFVRMEGQNFLTTESVASDNPDVIIDNVFVTDSAITAEITVASSAVAGPATITVTNSFGSDGIGVTLSDSVLRLSPGQTGIVPGSGGSLKAIIDPPLSTPLTIALKNSNPTIVSVPATVTIPASGTETINVYGNQEGAAIISAGGTQSVVFVSAPFAGEVSGLTGGRVSVYIEDSAEESTAGWANPVSVVLDASTSAPTTGMAGPVSVVVEDPLDEPSTTSSGQISVAIAEMIYADLYICPAIFNPGAEAGDTSGWSHEAGGFEIRNASPVPYEGSFYFFGGAQAESQMYQQVNLLAEGALASEIDTGQLGFKVDWMQASWNGSDQGQVRLRFKDAEQGLIGEVFSTLKAVGPGKTWIYREIQNDLPIGARYVDIVIRAKRNDGTNNDAYFDAINACITKLRYSSVEHTLINHDAESADT